MFKLFLQLLMSFSMTFADDPTHDPNVDPAQDRWKLKIHSNFLTLARRKNQLKSGVRTETLSQSRSQNNCNRVFNSSSQDKIDFLIEAVNDQLKEHNGFKHLDGVFNEYLLQATFS